MKLLRTIYLVLAVMLLFVACNEKVEPDSVPHGSSVYIDTLICVGGDAGTYRFSFFSVNQWKAEVDGSPEWCTVSPKNGGSGGATLGVKLSDNNDSRTRTATVRITSATHSGTIVINQEPLDILDLTNVDSSEFDANGGSFVINLDANIEYTVTIDSPWIECIQTKALVHDRLNFTVAKNDEGVERAARITFSGNEISREVVIKQHPAVIVSELDDNIVPQAGGTAHARVRSNVSYDIVMPPDGCVRMEESAFTEVTADGVETNNLYRFAVAANSAYYARELPVIFCNSEYNISDTITFVQERTDLFAVVPEPEFRFGPDSASFILDFDAGKAFDCQPGCDWITLETPRDKPYRRIFHISQNHSGAERSSRIVLADAGRAESVDIFQERIVMDYSRRLFEYSVGGGRDTLFFRHNIGHEVEMPEEEWCSIEEGEEGVFVIRIAETEEETPRECMMVFSAEHYQIADTVMIRQDQRDVMEVFPRQIDVPAAGDEVEVHVHANIPYEYVVEGNPEWVRENMDRSSDSVRVFYVRRNSEEAERQARIVFTGKTFKSVVTLLQRHPTLRVEEPLVNFTDDGGTARLDVDSNVECDVTAVPGGWLSAEIINNILEIKTLPNQDLYPRNGKVIVSNSFYGLADTVSVTQSAKDVFSLSQKQFQFDPYGGSFKVDVLANVEYTYRVEEGCGWIREGGRALSFEVDRNTSGTRREGHIIFSDSKSSTEVTVVQEAAYLRLSVAELEFNTSGGSAEVGVESNVKYIPGLQGCFWLQLVPDAGGLKVTASENETEEWRGTELSVAAPEFGLSVSVPVRQRQKDVFRITEKKFAFAPGGGSFRVDLYTNLDYTCTVVDQPVWLRSAGDLNFAVGKNTGEKVREAVLEFEAAGFRERVRVVQEAPVLHASADSCAVGAEGGIVKFTLTSNVELFEDLPDEGWIVRTDSGDGEYVFSVFENTTGFERVYYAIFSTDYGLDCMVRIVQAAAPEPPQEEPEEPEEPDEPDEPDQPEEPDEPDQPDQPDEPDEPVEPQVVPYITISETDFVIGPEGGVLPVIVESNIEYTHILDHAESWLTEGDGQDTFTVDRNTSGKSRFTSVVFAGEGVRSTVNVIQEGAYIIMPKTRIYLSGKGEDKVLDIDNNVPFKLSQPDDTWLEHSISDSGGVTVSAGENTSSQARESRFMVSSKEFGISHEVVVIQTPASGIFNPACLDYGPEGGVGAVSVYAEDYSYSVSDLPDWVHEQDRLVFAADTNFTGADRECFVKFMSGVMPDSLRITQSAAYLDVNQESFEEMGSDGGSFSFTVNSNVSYNVLAPDWIDVVADDGMIVCEVAENAGYEPRQCEITVASAYRMSHSFSFVQSGRKAPSPFTAKCEKFEIGPAGGAVVVEITPSEGAHYNESKLPSFMVEDKDRRNDSTFVFLVDASDSYREWKLALNDIHGQTINLRFMQAAPSVMLSSSSRLINADGGESLVTVYANISYQIYLPQDQPWVSYRKGSKADEYYFAAAPNTTGLERTASVLIGDTLSGVTRTLRIVQRENIYINADPPMLKCGWDGGELFLDLQSNADISVTSALQWSADKWFEISETDTPGRYLVTVDTNYQFKERSSSIKCVAGNTVKEVQIVQDKYRKEGLYYSQDFSADRTFRTIHKASDGRGINLVFMGDAFSDRQIASGTYDSLMNAAVKCLFDIEPYRSFKDLFNIYSVTAVSPTDVYEEGASTAMSTYFGTGTSVGGNEDMVKYYAQAALSEEEVQNSVMVVLMNKPVYAGTTYLMYSRERITDYGEGYAISYIPLCTSPEQFCQVLQHEVGGHAFGKLEDEYAYERNGEIPYDEVANYRSSQKRGYYKNVDFISDSASVLWSRFLHDERYCGEGLGVFEGACTYWNGAFRSSENSMMRYNTGGFNAPSREAIFYRMFRLAYGDDAEYDFEDFVKYDAVNRAVPTKSVLKSSGGGICPPGFVPLAHPVEVEK